MNEAGPSWRVVMTRMPASSRTSRSPRNDSPGTVNAYRTPAARSASAMNRPTVRGPLATSGSASCPDSVVRPRSGSGCTSPAASSSAGAPSVDVPSVGLPWPGVPSVAASSVAGSSAAGSSPPSSGVGASDAWGVGSSAAGVSSSVMATALLGRSVPARGGLSAVVLELQRDGKIEIAQSGDDALEIVTALAGHADGVTLDLRLDLRDLVPDEFGDLLRDLLRQPAAQPDRLADLVAAGFLHLAPVEDLERQVAPDRLGFDEVLDRRSSILVVGQKRDLILRLGELDGHTL